jgi:hypothetical protein
MANMLNFAGEAVRQAGFAKVDTRVMDAANIDLDADSLGTAMWQNVFGRWPRWAVYAQG